MLMPRYCKSAGAAEQLSQTLQTSGAFEVLTKEHELHESMDEVTGNMRKGRQLIVAFNRYFITCYHCMTTVVIVQIFKVEQAAILLSVSHPFYPDCLAIANLMIQTNRNAVSGTA